MPELRACPACGGEEHRRSRRRGLREHLLGWMGILPYVCKTCRKRFLASKNGAAARIGMLVVFLILAVACAWWLYKRSNPPQYQAVMSNTQAKAQAEALEGQLREQVGALAGSLVEVRREKAALMAELTLLRNQLRHSTDAQPAPKAAPPMAPPDERSLLGKVHFPYGSSELDPKARQTLAHLAQLLAQTPDARVLVVGATGITPLGSRTAARYEDNAGLAAARVLRVFRALRSMGVEQKRVTIVTAGQADSVKENGRTVGVWLTPTS